MFGEDVIEESGSGISDVEKTGGGRSKTDTHDLSHLKPSNLVFRSPERVSEFSVILNSKLQISNSKQVPNYNL